MKLFELLPIIQDEHKSEDYLRSVSILKTFSNCPRCHGTSLGMIRGDRWKCYKCKTEWTRRKDSVLSLVRIKYSEFLLCLKFFEMELTNQVCCSELGLNYKTVEMLYRYFRITFTEDLEISSFSPKSEIKGEEIFIYVNFVNNKVELSKDRNIFAPNVYIKIKRSRIPNSAAAYILKFTKNYPIKKRNKVISEFDRFWRFAKERLLRYRGVREMYFYQFLKEIEFRYNNRGQDLFQEISNQIAQKRWVVR